ncbi:MAG: UDP-N-acetylmuramoyl-tripeptide--D-alanyl-D-alanine ligase [Myxococcota bacterium]
MTAHWDLGELARAAGAEVRGGELPGAVQAVATDTRSLPPASLFVALRGERFDGHDFAAAAVAAGARALLVDREGDARCESLGAPRLVVQDTLRALGDLASFVRRQHAGRVVAITGSNGKTTTKELVAAVLAAVSSVHKTIGNLNNLVGLPLTLLAWPNETRWAVVEMGMNHLGEIARLTEIATPDVGVITNVAPAHLAGLGSVDAVARAKGELYAGLGATATAIVNADDPLVQGIAVPLLGQQKRLRFGWARGADVRIERYVPTAQGSRVMLELEGAPVELHLPLFGTHNAVNAAAAAAAAWALGVDRDVIASGMGNVRVPGGRLRVIAETRRRIGVIDDTYNANPHSMHAAFAALAERGTGRRVAVLGDMLELGDSAAALHREVGRSAAVAGLDWVVSFGELAEAVAEGARRAGAEATVAASLEDLLALLDRGLVAGDWVLVKGSRGMRMERVVDHLMAEGV